MGINLEGIVVNLRQISRLACLDWYDDTTGKVYFTIVHETGYYSINVNDELIHSEDASISGKEVEYSNVNEKEALMQTGQFTERPRSNKLQRILREPKHLGVQFLNAVLRHQVVGDKLTKGLRLSSSDFAQTNATIKDHFLGGYLVTKTNENGEIMNMRMNTLLKHLL